MATSSYGTLRRLQYFRESLSTLVHVQGEALTFISKGNIRHSPRLPDPSFPPLISFGKFVLLLSYVVSGETHDTPILIMIYHNFIQSAQTLVQCYYFVRD
jgi:hypothetical protein